jgi:hypothetical protein
MFAVNPVKEECTSSLSCTFVSHLPVGRAAHGFEVEGDESRIFSREYAISQNLPGS